MKKMLACPECGMPGVEVCHHRGVDFVSVEFTLKEMYDRLLRFRIQITDESAKHVFDVQMNQIRRQLEQEIMEDTADWTPMCDFRA